MLMSELEIISRAIGDVKAILIATVSRRVLAINPEATEGEQRGAVEWARQYNEPVIAVWGRGDDGEGVWFV